MPPPNTIQIEYKALNILIYTKYTDINYQHIHTNYYKDKLFSPARNVIQITFRIWKAWIQGDVLDSVGINISISLD